VAATFSALRSAFAGISPRERRILTALGVTLALLAFLGLYFWSATVLDDIEAERTAAVDALRTIRNERAHISERQQRHEQMLARYRVHAPPLTSFVEQAARAANITVAEAIDRTAPPVEGRRFQKRTVSIRLRHVDLQSLTTFVNQIDSADFPVAITSMRIHKRYGEGNSYDVDDMVIATWDRVEPSGAAPAGTGNARRPQDNTVSSRASQ
jgi:type II secretory pathway component PulM